MKLFYKCYVCSEKIISWKGGMKSVNEASSGKGIEA